MLVYSVHLTDTVWQSNVCQAVNGSCNHKNMVKFCNFSFIVQINIPCCSAINCGVENEPPPQIKPTSSLIVLFMHKTYIRNNLYDTKGKGKVVPNSANKIRMTFKYNQTRFVQSIASLLAYLPWHYSFHSLGTWCIVCITSCVCV